MELTKEDKKKLMTKVAKGIHTADSANLAVRSAITALSEELFEKFDDEDLKTTLDFFDWKCPYTGKNIRDLINNNEVAIDHIVPQNRESCGLNILGNLVVVDKKANANKSSKTIEMFITKSNKFFNNVSDEVLKERIDKIKAFQARYYNDKVEKLKLKDEMQELYSEVQKIINQRVDYILRTDKTEEKIGLIVNRDVREILSTVEFNENEISKFLDKEESKKLFGINYALLTENRQNNPKRYYRRPVIMKNGNSYYITNDWYKKNKEKVVEWIKNYKE